MAKSLPKTTKGLCGAAWIEMLQMLSTSTVSVIVFSIVIPAVISVGIATYTTVHAMTQNRKAEQSMALFFHALFDWPTLFTICVTVAAYALLLGVGTVRAYGKVTAERDGLIAENVALKQDQEPPSFAPHLKLMGFSMPPIGKEDGVWTRDKIISLTQGYYSANLLP